VDTQTNNVGTAKLFLVSAKGIVCLALIACIFWSYWPTLAELLHRWSKENNYSHGFLIPFFSAFLLYTRKEKMRDIKVGFYWAGLAFFLAGGLLRLAGAYIYFDWFDAFSFLFYLTGLTVLIGGKQAFLWAWPALGFLVFMIPLPFRLEISLSLPLQRLATQASTYALQTLGFPALSEGNVIHLQEVQLGIVEACNGLGMLVSFVALCTGVALVINRPLLDKIIIVLSAVPLGLLANIVRITTTGILHEMVGSELANFVFHDLAGWFMMPLALGFLWVELKILTHLLVLPKNPASKARSHVNPATMKKSKNFPSSTQV
jgi:exosortase